MEDNVENLMLQDFVFNMKEVPNPTILLVGKRFSGKSYTSVSIANKFAHVPRWAAWCGTKDTEDFWAERFGSHSSVRGPDESGKAYLAELIAYQQKKSRLYKKVLKQPFPNKFEIGLVFDDVTSDRRFRKGEILEDLFSNGRHYHAVIIISCQYLKQLPPAVRTNTDYIFMMHNTKRTIRLLYEDYVEEPDEFEMFSELLKAVTKQVDTRGKSCHNALVYDNAGTLNSRIDEIFKVYRTEDKAILDRVELGSTEWRTFNKAHYRDNDYEEQAREYNKRCKLQRLQQLRDSQAAQRYGVHQPLDIDYLSDSDSDDATSTTQSITLTSKRGSRMHVNINRPQPTNMSVPDTSYLPPGPLGPQTYGPAPPLRPHNVFDMSRPHNAFNMSQPNNAFTQKPAHTLDRFDPSAFVRHYSQPAYGRMF